MDFVGDFIVSLVGAILGDILGAVLVRLDRFYRIPLPPVPADV